jgi:hypothetical protein
MAQAHQNNFWRYKAEVGFCGALLALSAAACSGNHQTSPQPPSAKLCPNISSRVFLAIASGDRSQNPYLKIDVVAAENGLSRSGVINQKTYTGTILESGDSTCTYILDREAPRDVHVNYLDAASSNQFTRTYDYDGKFLREQGQPTR